MFWILYCWQKSFGLRDLCGISYSVLFKLNGENKRMLYLAFHILYCVRCVQLWERTDAVEQWMIFRGYTSLSPPLSNSAPSLWQNIRFGYYIHVKNHNYWHRRCSSCQSSLRGIHPPSTLPSFPRSSKPILDISPWRIDCTVIYIGI